MKYEVRVIDRTLVYPPHVKMPEDLGYFIEHRDFTDVWKQKGFTDDDLIFLQAGLMIDSTHSPYLDLGNLCVVEFRSAEKKIRFWYKYIQDASTVVLIFAFAECGEDVDLSISEANKKLLREIAAKIEAELKIPRKV